MAKIQLSPEARRLKADYQRQWAEKNRDKTRKYLENYWERKASELKNTDVTPTISVTPISVTDTVTCQNCGEPFTPQRSTAKFCSDNCRVAYNRKK